MNKKWIIASLCVATIVTGCKSSKKGSGGGDTDIDADLVGIQITSTAMKSDDGLGFELPIDYPAQFNATAIYENGATEVITDKVTWSVGDETIVMISSSPAVTVLAIAEGETTINAAYEDQMKSADILVSGAQITGNLETSGPELALIDNIANYTSTANFDNNKSLDLTPFVAWSVSDEAVATIDDKGQLTPVAAGITQVRTAYDEQGLMSPDYEVQITDASTEDVTLNQLTLSSQFGTLIPVGTFNQLNAELIASYNSRTEIFDVTSQVEWDYTLCPDLNFATDAGTIRFAGKTDNCDITASFNIGSQSISETISLASGEVVGEVLTLTCEDEYLWVSTQCTTTLTSEINQFNGITQFTENDVTALSQFMTSDGNTSKLSFDTVIKGQANVESQVNGETQKVKATYAALESHMGSEGIELNIGFPANEVTILTPNGTDIYVNSTLQLKAESDGVDVTNLVDWTLDNGDRGLFVEKGLVYASNVSNVGASITVTVTPPVPGFDAEDSLPLTVKAIPECDSSSSNNCLGNDSFTLEGRVRTFLSTPTRELADAFGVPVIEPNSDQNNDYALFTQFYADVWCKQLNENVFMGHSDWEISRLLDIKLFAGWFDPTDPNWSHRVSTSPDIGMQYWTIDRDVSIDLENATSTSLISASTGLFATCMRSTPVN